MKAKYIFNFIITSFILCLIAYFDNASRVDYFIISILSFFYWQNRNYIQDVYDLISSQYEINEVKKSKLDKYKKKYSDEYYDIYKKYLQ